MFGSWMFQQLLPFFFGWNEFSMFEVQLYPQLLVEFLYFFPVFFLGDGTEQNIQNWLTIKEANWWDVLEFPARSMLEQPSWVLGQVVV